MKTEVMFGEDFEEHSHSLQTLCIASCSGTQDAGAYPSKQRQAVKSKGQFTIPIY